ncbi:MAG: response regulator [Hyphomicrobium sp.]
MALKILIVEDEPILAIELECIVKEMGHEVVGVARSSHGAVALAQTGEPDLALVDVHLTDGPTGPEAARQIAGDRGATVLFTTSNPERVPADFANACGVLTKPYSDQGIKSAINFISECMANGAASRPAPHMLKLAPNYRERWRV